MKKPEEQEQALYPSLYEEDFILRSLGSIVKSSDIALTELVANSWDAGASHVRIFIPEKVGETLYVDDDGIGMSESEFRNHWMKMRYNRLKEQGKNVLSPDGSLTNRIAFGKNGVGRHGLFCFGTKYKVITQKDGVKLSLEVKANVANNPFAVTKQITEETQEHGTRLEVVVERNLPKVEDIRTILSSRFLQDPQFVVEVNHQILSLENLIDGTPSEINIDGTNVNLHCYFIDTSKSGRKSIFQGIAFWQNGRMVGEPSWSLGKRVVLDGRTTYAKRYTFVIRTNDLSDEVKEDWSGFRDSALMEKIYDKVEEYVNSSFINVTSNTVEYVTNNLDSDVKESFKKVNPLVRREINRTIKRMVEDCPTVKQESVNIAVKAIINLEKTKNGQKLLEKLSVMSEKDIAGLNELLDNWEIGDAMAVLTEIDRRLAIISAIRKLAGDDNTDELHVLHPLIAESRWLFGPEYESSEYIFNRQLKTCAKEIFKDVASFTKDTNYKKRPDLICLPDSTISLTGLEDSDIDTGLVQFRRILLIELKKGGFDIKRKERDQANGYIEDLLHSNLGVNCYITGFVVGHTIADNLSAYQKNAENAILYVTTYDQLVDTAERRMFGLRSLIASRYDYIPGMDLYNQLHI